MNIRQSRILNLLEKSDRFTVSQLKEIFEVSEMTIRRDLSLLEKLGYVTRIHGGVVARRKPFFNNTFSQREKEHREKKMAIARTAVRLIAPNDNIILDTGTTTLYIARELAKTNTALTVATTSLTVASTLFNTNIDVLLFGGFLRREIPDLIGPLTEKNLEEFHANKLFIGCDGVLVEEGFFTSDLNISHIEEKMVRSAERVIVVADSSKFGKKSFVKYADIGMVHTVITDRGIDEKMIKKLKNRGIEVIIS